MTRPTLRPTLRIAAAATAALLPLGMLAGCGEDDQEPTSEDPTSAAPSESDSESPEEPVEPEPPAAMEKPNVAGATAFVEYYFEALSFAALTGESRLAQSLASDDCAACRGAVGAIDKTYSNGGTMEGGTMTAEHVRLEPLQGLPSDMRPYGGRVTLDVTRQVVEGSGDKRLDGVSKPGKVPLQIQLLWSEDGWRMVEWSQEP